MIGFIAEKQKKKFNNDLLQKARLLCQDADCSVRKVMATEVIEKICYAIENKNVQYQIMDKIMELVYD